MNELYLNNSGSRNLIKSRTRKIKSIFSYFTILLIVFFGFVLLLNQVGYRPFKEFNLPPFFLSDNLDFSIKHISTNGNRHTRQSDIIDATFNNNNNSIFSFDSKKAIRNLNNLDWIKSVDLIKLYPSTLHVNITEYNPIAIWFYEKEKYVIGEDGQVVDSLNADNFLNLKMIVGDNAALAAPGLIEQLNSRPKIGNKVKSILRVGNRRWTLRLYNGIEIYLPEDNYSSSLDELIELNDLEDILNKYIKIIDMRLPKRIDITPSKFNNITTPKDI
ncbi:MAG: cell division protein FtsQ/DivIB [Alphaproteobacteria bacterium]|jgi:cell division protein FtsQ